LGGVDRERAVATMTRARARAFREAAVGLGSGRQHDEATEALSKSRAVGRRGQRDGAAEDACDEGGAKVERQEKGRRARGTSLGSEDAHDEDGAKVKRREKGRRAHGTSLKR
jgi:hypothetical protein